MTNYRKKLDRVSNRYMVQKETIARLKEELKEAMAQEADVEDAQAIIQTVAQSLQQYAHQRIAGIVTRALHTVFGDEYTFVIEFEQKRGKTEAAMWLEDQDGNELHPTEDVGGGVGDVISFALRLARVVLTHPPLRRVMLLDEPFKFVSVDKRDTVRRLLETLSKELEVQFIIVTHMDELKCGKVINL